MTEKPDFSSPAKVELNDAVVQLLNRQGENLNPAELLGLLSLCNLLSILNFLNKEDSSPNLAKVSALAQNLAQQGGGEKGVDPQGLLNSLLGMVGSKGKQKLNPATLLALVNLLGEAEKKEPSQQKSETQAPPSGQEPSQEEIPETDVGTRNQ